MSSFYVSLSVTLPLMATLILIAVALIVFLFIISYKRYVNRIFRFFFRRRKPIPQVDRSPDSIEQATIYGRGKNWFYTNRNEFINVRIDSFDGTKLAGYYRPSADRKTRYACLFVHGFDEEPSEMGQYARLMMRQFECYLLITHLRAHRMSGSGYNTYGLFESVDIMKWIDFLKVQIGEDVKIFIVSRDMGALATVLSSEQSEFSKNVGGIILDSPLISFSQYAEKIIKPPFPTNRAMVMDSIRKKGQKLFNIDIELSDSVIHADKIRVPVLMFSAGNDNICYPQEVRMLYDSINSPKRLITIDHAEHGMCYERAQATFEREVRGFVERCVVRLVSMGRL